jgi:hypothetical protein
MPAVASLLRSPVFWAMTISIFLYSYFWFFVLTWIPTYLVMARGMSHLKMDVALGTPLVGMSVVGFVAKFWEEATQASTSRLSVNLG